MLQWESVCELVPGTEPPPALSHHLGFPFSSSFQMTLSINWNTLLLQVIIFSLNLKMLIAFYFGQKKM